MREQTKQREYEKIYEIIKLKEIEERMKKIESEANIKIELEREKTKQLELEYKNKELEYEILKFKMANKN